MQGEKTKRRRGRGEVGREEEWKKSEGIPNREEAWKEGIKIRKGKSYRVQGWQDGKEEGKEE